MVQSRDEPPRGDELNRTFVRSFSRSRLHHLDHKLVCTPEENTFRIATRDSAGADATGLSVSDKTDTPAGAQQSDPFSSCDLHCLDVIEVDIKSDALDLLLY